ncbi:MAG: cysteine protease [Planctomycetota bacterium]|nr:MAG: cysteine protease [Planctomycetota bacterium]
MALFEPRGFGWLPSAPDFRDFTPGSAESMALLQRLAGGESSSTRSTSVDLREYFVEVTDQLDLPTSTAQACCALAQYFERRAIGRLLRPSPLFLYQNTLRLAGTPAGGGTDLRTTLRAMIRCGVPPERYWPYERERLAAQPDGFLYRFDDPYRAIRYVRLDERKASGLERLHTIKAFVSAGFPAVFGVSVPDSLTDDGHIPYRPTFDTPLGGQAMVVVGYDDRWLQGTRGALLVRSSWGARWGEAGYGWLPYAFVEELLAVDFFTLCHPRWIDSGEFEMPGLSRS